MSKTSNIQPEIAFNLILIIFSFFVTIESLRLGLGTLRKPGLGTFSFFIGLILLITNIIPILFFKHRAHREPLFNKHEMRKYLSMIIVFISWIVAISFLGYILVTLLATFSFSKIMGLKGWLIPSFLAVGTSLFSYLIFDFWLYTDLPRGIFW